MAPPLPSPKRDNNIIVIGIVLYPYVKVPPSSMLLVPFLYTQVKGAIDGNWKSNVSLFGMVLILTMDGKSSCFDVCCLTLRK